MYLFVQTIFQLCSSYVTPLHFLELLQYDKLLSNPDEVTGMDGRIRALKCSVEYLSFSAHVDFVENKSFIDDTNPANIILVHGESTEMLRLKEELNKKFATLPDCERPLVQSPKNCQEICIEFHREKLAKAVGSLTGKLNYPPSSMEETETDESNTLSGLLVIKDFNSRLVAAEDLVSYTQLKVSSCVFVLAMAMPLPAYILRLIISVAFCFFCSLVA